MRQSEVNGWLRPALYLQYEMYVHRFQVDGRAGSNVVPTASLQAHAMAAVSGIHVHGLMPGRIRPSRLATQEAMPRDFGAAAALAHTPGHPEVPLLVALRPTKAAA